MADRFDRMLQEHLALDYRADVMKIGIAKQVRDAFNRHAQKYPELGEAARKALAQTPDETAVDDKRCVITKHRRSFLRHVVGALQEKPAS